ncbi:MAG: zinc dependent phospholipase C family protein [Pseudomonadota bacterium]
MNTPAHLILAAAIWARPTRRGGRPARQARINAAALIGSVLPDLSLYFMVLWEARVNGRSPAQIFGEDYRDPFWQTVFAVDNSIPLWLGLTALAAWRRWAVLGALSGAALLHVLTDLPLHHNDGRAHFMPFTDWIFESPVSYWDPNHYGWLVGPVEALLCVGLSILLWRRFRSRLVHALIGVALLLEVAPALIFPLMFG